MLEARDIGKLYGATIALNEASLTIRPGEILALAGENGSGKSTMAKILSGLLRPNAGEIRVDGQPRAFGEPRQAMEAGIVLVAQEPTVVPEMSIAENVLLASLGRPGALISRARLADEARPLLEQVGVQVDPMAKFASLKTGDRELVEVARALALKPRYLILDEAISRLGERDARRLFRIVHDLRDRGTSTVLITHRLHEMTENADRAVVLRDGCVVGELAREELSEERLSAMMVGRELKQFFHKRSVEPRETMLQVEDLVVAGTTEPVSLSVRQAEVVGLAGLVGSGRTELLETIAGARPARRGRVFVAGHRIQQASPRAALRAGVALVPEDRHRQGLVLESTVRENVALGCWKPFSRANRRRECTAAQKAMRQLGIRAQHVDSSIRSLSGGNQQKVVLARCLASKPSVLLLDEPTRGVDVGAREELYDVIGKLVTEGMAVLLASSDLLEIIGICDRVVVMHESRIAGELSRDQATEERIALLSGGGVC